MSLSPEHVHHGQPCDCAEAWHRINEVADNDSMIVVCGACGVAKFKGDTTCPWCDAVQAS